MKKKPLFILSIICIIFITIYSLIKLTLWFYDNYHLENLHKDLQKYYEQTYILETNQDNLINPPDNLADTYWQYIDTPYLQIDFTDLKQHNSDTVAWLRVNGTLVDYPVVQTTNNDYYLTHTFDQKNSQSGWIFSDFRNNLLSLNNNSIIYGHRRLNDSMFGSLRKTLYSPWLDNKDNHLIYLSTLNSNMIWQIFSIYTIKEESYYLTTHFKNNEEYNTFLTTILNRSIHDFQTNLNINDKILTLSTCENQTGKTRIVIHAKLIKKETRY